MVLASHRFKLRPSRDWRLAFVFIRPQELRCNAEQFLRRPAFLHRLGLAEESFGEPPLTKLDSLKLRL